MKGKKNKTTSTRTSKSKGGLFSTIRSIVTNEDIKRVLGFVLGMVTLCVFLASASYFVTGASDQSLLGQYEELTAQINTASQRIEELQDEMDDASDNGKEALQIQIDEVKKERKSLTKKRQSVCDHVQNWIGYRGAVLADRLMNGTFGVATFCLLVFPFALSFSLIVSGRNRRIPLLKLFFFSVIFAVWGSLLLAFLFYHVIETKGFFNVGGNYGIETSQWLINNIGTIGTLILLIVSGLIFMTFTFSNLMSRWLSVFDRKEPATEPAADNFANVQIMEEEQVAETTSILPEAHEEHETIAAEVFNVTSTVEEPAEETQNADVEIVSTDTTITTDAVISDNKDYGDADDDENTHDEDEHPYDPLEAMGPYDPHADLPNYKMPSIELLKDYPGSASLSDSEKMANRQNIITTLKRFNIGIKQIFETIGPTVTLYEIVPDDGVRVSRVRQLEDDIMMSLKAKGIRIIAPIPGKGTIGIEVPNDNPSTVSMRSVIASRKFQECSYSLPVAIGRTITNEVFTFDLCKMPHLLVAGATGQGKSVGLNAIITSLLYKKHPSELKFVLVDPKKVEFSIYSDIERHYLAELPESDEPVITDVDRVKQTLNSICKEMDTRYDLLKMVKARTIKEYNDKFVERKLNPHNGHRYLPYIVVVIDEFGDLIMTAGKEVEMPIARIAQLARAVGIHMIIATQRPSVNVITGIIKANFPARIAFRVMTAIDSKTILDASGANRLIGKGDMLFTQGNETTRIQCAFVDTPEVEKIVNHVSSQAGYPTAFMLPEPDAADNASDGANSVDLGKRDALFEEVARYVVSNQACSASNIQRKFEIGFVRAARVVDQLEAAGIVSAANGSKPRQVLVPTTYELEQMISRLNN